MNRTRSLVKFMIRGTKPKEPVETSEGIPVESTRFGDGVVRAFELVFTPIIFALIGLALDNKLNTTPIFTLGFFFFGIAGMTIKLWYISFAPQSSPEFLQSGESSSKVIRRSKIKSVELGELLGGDLEVPADLDLTLDRKSGKGEKNA